MTKKNILQLAILLIIAAVFIIHAFSLSFTQDDSYISYRYVKNFLNGNGLVFNPGEYVEGYTNFLFVILMAFFGALGINFIFISKLIGIGSGLAIILLAFFWSRPLFEEKPFQYLAYFPPLALAANPAFCYWATSGMETTLFAAFVAYGLFFASERNNLFVLSMALATLTRPDGGLIFALIIAYLLFSRTCSLKESLRHLAIFALLIIPQLIFRFYYYHDLLPNSFYAKTGAAIEYLQGGIRYLWLFMKMYGLGGLILIIPLIAYKSLSGTFRLMLIVVVVYIVYIIAVGGDVLHEHRFFIPLLLPLYLCFAAAIGELSGKLWPKKESLIRFAAIIIIAFSALTTYLFPREEMKISRDAMNGLVRQMRLIAETLNNKLGHEYIIACTTIGAISYFGNSIVIDMIGLTDWTIAHQPQDEIPGIVSDWKERQYNVPYLMKRQPDFILFSTGLKPTAPAERVLFLSSKFRQGYYPVMELSPRFTIYKLKSDVPAEDAYTGDPTFINLYVGAANFYTHKIYDSAYILAARSDSLAPKDFYSAATLMGDISMAQQKYLEAFNNMQRAYDLSGGYAIEAADKLSRLHQAAGNDERAQFFRHVVDTKNQLK
jgi:arabinofuranosyltransferase